jgi:hypothetical protein
MRDNMHDHTYVELVIGWTVLVVYFLGPWVLAKLKEWRDARREKRTA